MKIFLTGGTGQVGFELQRCLSPWGEILAPTRHELDLSDMSAVSHWLEERGPDCIVNAAAYTAVDKAETDRQTALRINRDLPYVLAQYAAKHPSGSSTTPPIMSTTAAVKAPAAKSHLPDLSMFTVGASWLETKRSWTAAHPTSSSGPPGSMPPAETTS